ncbi:MAG: DNA repair protein RecO [Sphaerochaetaceae bacterium]|jgi:DNA repair protein RecO (recombination protein O)
MERDIKVEAIVLSTKRWGELNRLVTLLSSEIGVFNALVYGARKGKLASAIEPLVSGTYYIYHNKAKGHYSIKDVELKSDALEIKKDLVSYYIAQMMVELALKMHGGDYHQLFSVLKLSLSLLEEKQNDPKKIFILYGWALLAISGLQSDLKMCPNCSKVYEDDEILGFNYKTESPCCLKCAQIEDEFDQLILPPGARRYLDLTQELDLDVASTVQLSPRATERLFRYIVAYFNSILGVALKSLDRSILFTDFD